MNDARELFAEWIPVAPCQLKDHARELHGCVRSEGGAYIVLYGHPTGGQCLLDNPVRDILAVVCQGHAIYTRNRKNDSFMCPYCNLVMSFDLFARVLGPVMSTPKREENAR